MKKINLILLNLAGNLPFCVHYLKVSLFTFTNFLLLTALICLTAPSVNAQSGVGVKTDLGIYPEGPAPPLPGAGGKITDSTFGTQIMRVTDEQDGMNFGTAYSYWSTFNLDNTRLLVHSYSGTAYLYEFNPMQFNLGAKQVMILPPGSGYTTTDDAVWSAIDPNKLFIHRGAVFYAFNAQQLSYTAIGDLSSQFPAGSYLFQMSVSRDDNIFAFTVRNPDYSVRGYAVWERSSNKLLYNVVVPILDEVQIDKSGRYLVVKTDVHGPGAIEVKIVDLQAQPVKVTDLTDNAPDYSPGHSDNGAGVVIGNDNWGNRILKRNLATPRSFTTVYQFPLWDSDTHISLLADNEEWALISFNGTIASGVFNRELVLMATDGSQRVKRFAHHYSRSIEYSNTPRANISRDGRFVAFTSDWGGSNRTDLFIAQVPSSSLSTPSTSPTPTPNPTPSSSNAVFGNVIGFGMSGGNRLDKLTAPYFAFADTKAINTDGGFSYKYNHINNGRDISVWLDDGTHTFKVVNQGKYLEVWVDGVYKTDFLINIDKTIVIERIGGVVKIWEDAALRYFSLTGASNGTANFKVNCGGDPTDSGLGINSVMITGVTGNP